MFQPNKQYRDRLTERPTDGQAWLGASGEQPLNVADDKAQHLIRGVFFGRVRGKAKRRMKTERTNLLRGWLSERKELRLDACEWVYPDIGTYYIGIAMPSTLPPFLALSLRTRATKKKEEKKSKNRIYLLKYGETNFKKN